MQGLNKGTGQTPYDVWPVLSSLLVPKQDL